jgi:hypothetical protein
MDLDKKKPIRRQAESSPTSSDVADYVGRSPKANKQMNKIPPG